jgi:DNA ligase-1
MSLPHRAPRRESFKSHFFTGEASRFAGLEKKYGFRLLSGEMEIGAVDGVLLSAIAASSKLDLNRVRRAYMTMGDIGHIAELALTNPGAVESARIIIFNPIRPMLAEMATSIREILESHRRGTAFEYKYDGARVQIHKRGDEVRIFSRRLTDVTTSSSRPASRAFWRA